MASISNVIESAFGRSKRRKKPFDRRVRKPMVTLSVHVWHDRRRHSSGTGIASAKPKWHPDRGSLRKVQWRRVNPARDIARSAAKMSMGKDINCPGTEGTPYFPLIYRSEWQVGFSLQLNGSRLPVWGFSLLATNGDERKAKRK